MLWRLALTGLGARVYDWIVNLIPDDLFDVWISDDDEPTVLAYTPDDEMERGVEEFKAQWPDKWDAWLRWCEAEET